jgi:hypothetical protein
MRYSGVIPTNVLRLMSSEERRKLGKAGVLPEEGLAKEEVRRERDLQNQIRSLLSLRGIVFYQARMDRRTTGTIGWPDFSFAVNGRAMAWECKLPGKDLDPEQKRVIAQMEANGWLVLIVRSLAFAKDALDELTRRC